jgi:hypothetical protein
VADSAADHVTITTLNSRPHADVGDDQLTFVGSVVQLDGSRSSDVDGDLLSHRWSFTSVPPWLLVQTQDRWRVGAIWLPVSRALIEVGRGNYAAAREKLQPARPFELGYISSFWTIYVSGLSYLGERRPGDSSAEFEKILKRRSLSPASPLYPLAQLGFARAAAMADDHARSRTAYQDLFALWQNAYPDLPPLVQARQEYARLN